MRWLLGITCLIAPCVAAAVAASAAPQFSVIHTFTGGTDGAYPTIGLLRGADGSLYGTTEGGDVKSTFGTVFKLSPPVHDGASWTKTNLYAFQGRKDGAYPWTRLIFDGNTAALLGTTAGDDGHGDIGTIFRLAPPKHDGNPWTEQILHRFKGGTDSGFPYDGLVQDPATGAIYGTAYGNSGSGDFGTVFGYTPDIQHKNWSETLHYNFTAMEGNGAFPEAGLVLGSGGLLYGTTLGGGAQDDSCFTNGVGGFIPGCGTVFSVNVATGEANFLLLPSFTTKQPVYFSYGELLLDDNSNIFGLSQGGAFPLDKCKLKNHTTCGTVFTMLPESDTKAKVISKLIGANSGQSEGGLIWNQAKTVLYGTTTIGGPGCDADKKYGCGVVFKLTQDGKDWDYSVIYAFTGGADGYRARDLVIDGNGTLYGEAELGGANGVGTVFKIETP
ncbi:MAG TPA: choice-of-anchor tandem repeat GloVer-containing protein [Rhizomicrobium sp.]|nr:choice-of-anchor tandem repeat GloVer-containing protein [Rhizomicrobium sp.]